MLEELFTEDKYRLIRTAAVDPNHEPEDPGRLPTLNGATGELMKVIPLLRMYRISRRRFRKFCAEDINVQYNKKLDNMSYSDDGREVAAHFADGTSATGTLVIGADGAQSQTRSTVFGEAGAAKRVPYSAVNLHVCYNDAEKAKFVRQMHPIMTHGIHPDGYWLWISIQDVPDPEDPATWVFQLQSTWKSVEGEDVANLENLKRRAATYGEPFRSANLWIPEGTRIYENKLSYWEPIPWDTKNGRILLAGDAGHPMTFQRGQGLNHGIADAKSIVSKLKAAVDGRFTVEEALAAYQAEMVERAGDEVRLSLQNTEMLHDWSRMKDSPLMQKGGYAKGQENAATPVAAKS